MGALVFLVLWFLLMYVLNMVWLKPWELRKKLEKQGITGPMPSLLVGNVPEMKRIQHEEAKKAQIKSPNFHAGHDYAPTLFPYLEQWRKQYGPLFVYSTGKKLHLYMNRPDLVKNLSMSMSWNLGKPLYLTKAMAPIFGSGVIRSNGQSWADQRKIIAPELYMDRVKGMASLIVESAMSLVKSWEKRIEDGGGMAEIKIDQDLRNYSADVISRACFGSSYHQGEEIFFKLRALKNIMSEQSFLFRLCNISHFPTMKNRAIWRLKREIQTLILNLLNQRNGLVSGHENDDQHNDLLHAMLKAASRECPGLATSSQFIVDNCKGIYFAGHDTTSITATWCLMLLAIHPEWQDRIREEVLRVCGNGLPNANALNNLKTVKMVIQETLRLYPPSPFVSREVLEDIKIGDFLIPKGVLIWTSIPALHHDYDIWGPDANKFNPGRFAKGLKEACKLPQVYVPFGLGPRICLGQNFALAQLKVVLALILSRFSFSLSANYKHSFAYRMTVEPENGVDLLMTKLGK
ncbi:hypothetical protein Sjap_011999 [Stephania japonica]|uniref:Cytochrome P450 n=1 Tax=Stephania japonica TaxID=461633 RepID=A0AAP0P571_9MAGN